MGIKSSFERWKNIVFQLKKQERRLRFIEMNMENNLLQNYASLQNNQNSYKNEFRSKEYKVHSQNGEDGLLLYIFSQIGVTNRKFVEFGIGDGTECLAANLILNFGWSGVMIEGSKEYAISASEYYSQHPKVQGSVNVVNDFITKDNINTLIEQGGITGEIDLLSVDIDGNDYWVWDRIETISPRVVVTEYNATFGSEKAYTIPYDPAFVRLEKHPSGYYHGMSLKAAEKLAHKKGYVLIGCDSEGVNAFFVRNDLALGQLKSLSAKEAYYEQRVRVDVCPTIDQFNVIKHLPIEEV